MSQDPGIDRYLEICKKASHDHIPFRVQWELTHRCNEICRHCYLDGHTIPRELTLAEIKNIMDQLAAEGCLFFTFTGGEPLLRPDFFEITGYARQKEFVFRLLTNGTLITPSVADRLASLHPQAVEISIYAMQPELHDSVTRVPGSHARSVRALRLLHERGVRVIVKSPLMQDTVAELDALKGFADTLGGGIVYSTRLVPMVSGSTEPLSYAVDESGLKAFFKERLDGWELRDLSPDSRLCNAGIDSACLDPYGRVYPCVQLRLEAGNLRRASFRSIWHNSSVLKHVRSVRFSKLRPCQKCKYKLYCFYCMGISQCVCGDRLQPAPVLCEEARVRWTVCGAKSLGQDPKNERKESSDDGKR